MLALEEEDEMSDRIIFLEDSLVSLPSSVCVSLAILAMSEKVAGLMTPVSKAELEVTFLVASQKGLATFCLAFAARTLKLSDLKAAAPAKLPKFIPGMGFENPVGTYCSTGQRDVPNEVNEEKTPQDEIENEASDLMGVIGVG